MEIIFHILNAQVPALLYLTTLSHVGIFIKQPSVYIETIQFHSIQDGLPKASQLKVGEGSQNLYKYQVAVPEVPKAGDVW